MLTACGKSSPLFRFSRWPLAPLRIFIAEIRPADLALSASVFHAPSFTRSALSLRYVSNSARLGLPRCCVCSRTRQILRRGSKLRRRWSSPLLFRGWAPLALTARSLVRLLSWAPLVISLGTCSLQPLNVLPRHQPETSPPGFPRSVAWFSRLARSLDTLVSGLSAGLAPRFPA